MKMKKTILFAVVLKYFILTQFLIGQTINPEKNLKKYWKYRERLKNFVVVGDCQGCSIPSASRGIAGDIEFTAEKPWEGDNDTEPGGPEDAGELDYGDATILWGHYLAFLATEYALMEKNGVTSHLYETKREIYYAIEALNRLDIKAEYWWRYYYKEDGTGANQFDIDLNGFFIRDDINQNPDDIGGLGFGNTFINGDLVENHLNSSLCPPLDGHKANYFSSGFYEGINEVGSNYTAGCAILPNQNGKHIGPREVSLDQICQIMMGLALASKYIPPGENFVNTPFTGLTGNSDFSIEIKLISQRINDMMQLSLQPWNINNSVTGKCVNGVFWEQDYGYNDIPNPSDGCKCNPGGSNFELLSYGFASANSYIQTNYNAFATPFYYTPHYGADVLVGLARSVWESGYETAGVYGVQDVYKVFTLGAIGNTWTSTGNNIANRITPAVGDLWHLPLVHQVLFEEDNLMSPLIYECFLDLAPCDGPVLNDFNPIWSANKGLVLGGFNSIYDPTPSPNNEDPGRKHFDGEDSGIDYLLYFNLYNLAYPGYCPSYRYISPYELAPVDIIKEGYSETDHKNFIAANTITAQMGTSMVNISPDGPNDNQDETLLYIIQNDNDDQPMPFAKANVTFQAGQEVHLAAGFEVHAGAEFRASINPSILAMDCVNPTDLEACLPLVIAGRSHEENDNSNQTEEEYLEALEKLKSTKAYVVSSKNKQELTITPNPNNGSFQISVSRNNKPISIKEIKVFDIMGKVIWETGTSSNNIFTIDITSYAEGIYYVRCVNEFDEMEMKKLIKQ